MSILMQEQNRYDFDNKFFLTFYIIKNEKFYS